MSVDLSPEELDHMYEASKSDHNSVVGSEVRQMVGMIRRSAERIEALEEELRNIDFATLNQCARIEALEAANNEAAIKSAAMKTGIVIHRQDYGDFISDGPVNLSRFVRYLLAPEQDK